MCEQCGWEEIDEDANLRRESMRKHIDDLEGEHALPPENPVW
jgi:hypothetical protein